MGHSTGYILAFAAGVCLVCSVVVSGAAESLRERQTINKQLDQKKKVLTVAGLMETGEDVTPEEVDKRFADNITAHLVDLAEGTYADATAEEIANFDQRKARQDPDRSQLVDRNSAQVQRVPLQALVYLIAKDGAVEKIVLPVEGKGLWSTLYGFIALEKDTNTIAGITFYEHGETPGLGGEVENPRWQAKWPGRKAFEVTGETWVPKIDVIKGAAGTTEEAPFAVDGLAGATITGRGVGYLLRFWLDDARFGKYLSNFRQGTLGAGGSG